MTARKPSDRFAIIERRARTRGHSGVPRLCTVNGSNATCPIDEDVRSVPLRLTPVPASRQEPEAGSVSRRSAMQHRAYPPVTALVTAGAGTDLVNLLDTEIDEPAQPGERSRCRPFYDAGDKEADGFDLIGVSASGSRPDIPAGCQTRTDDCFRRTIVRCTVNGTIPPGDDASPTVTTLTARLTPDALFWEGVDVEHVATLAPGPSWVSSDGERDPAGAHGAEGRRRHPRANAGHRRVRQRGRLLPYERRKRLRRRGDRRVRVRRGRSDGPGQLRPGQPGGRHCRLPVRRRLPGDRVLRAGRNRGRRR